MVLDVRTNYDTTELRGANDQWFTGILWMDQSGKAIDKSVIEGLGGIHLDWATVAKGVDSPAVARKARIIIGVDGPLEFRTGQFLMLDNVTFGERN